MPLFDQSCRQPLAMPVPALTMLQQPSRHITMPSCHRSMSLLQSVCHRPCLFTPLLPLPNHRFPLVRYHLQGWRHRRLSILPHCQLRICNRNHIVSFLHLDFNSSLTFRIGDQFYLSCFCDSHEFLLSCHNFHVSGPITPYHPGRPFPSTPTGPSSQSIVANLASRAGTLFSPDA